MNKIKRTHGDNIRSAQIIDTKNAATYLRVIEREKEFNERKNSLDNIIRRKMYEIIQSSSSKIEAYERIIAWLEDSGKDGGATIILQDSKANIDSYKKLAAQKVSSSKLPGKTHAELEQQIPETQEDDSKELPSKTPNKEQHGKDRDDDDR